MTADEWIEAFAAELGLPPPGEERVAAILALAATAAHSSERTAAPVAAWLAGATGRPLDEANEIAARVAGSDPGAGA
jgi:uncharacterized protein DUF6457